jgi:hypothetical protein
MPAAPHRQATAAVVGGLMAATAKVRGWTFVTRNVADLARSDVRLSTRSAPLRARWFSAQARSLDGRTLAR